MFFALQYISEKVRENRVNHANFSPVIHLPVPIIIVSFIWHIKNKKKYVRRPQNTHSQLFIFFFKEKTFFLKTNLKWCKKTNMTWRSRSFWYFENAFCELQNLVDLLVGFLIGLQRSCWSRTTYFLSYTDFPGLIIQCSSKPCYVVITVEVDNYNL